MQRLGYDHSARGEVALNRRYGTLGHETYELIVNGAFVMDTTETSTERLLASSALRRLLDEDLRILVGGLGLGFTVAELLHSPRVAAVDVVELEPALVDWIRDDLVPHTAGVLSDPRVRVRVGDVHTAVRDDRPGSYHAILLDVDNGPDWLVHEPNAQLYERPFLTACVRALRPGGLLSVWSSERARPLHRLLGELFVSCDELHETVNREGRRIDYYLYLANT